MIMTPRTRSVLFAIAFFALVSPASAVTLDLDDPNVIVLVREMPSGHKLISMTFMLDEWPAGETIIFRKFCPPGMLMFNAGFAILGGDANIRRYVRLTNMRNLLTDEGSQGFSWYLRNDGPATTNVILEMSFTGFMTGANNP